VDEPTVADVCDRLISAANAAGGFDNITVVAARFDGAGSRRPPPATRWATGRWAGS
jgi:serine/threonine protein phosphatase PrpC